MKPVKKCQSLTSYELVKDVCLRNGAHRIPLNSSSNIHTNHRIQMRTVISQCGLLSQDFKKLCLIRCSSCCFIRASITGRSECHLTDRPANMSSLWKQTWEDRISGTELIPLNQMFVGLTARCIADGCGEAQSCRIFLSLMSLHGFHDAHVSLLYLFRKTFP